MMSIVERKTSYYLDVRCLRPPDLFFSPEKEKFLNSGTVLLIVPKIVEDIKKETRR